jgi:hypothetical protein
LTKQTTEAGSLAWFARWDCVLGAIQKTVCGAFFFVFCDPSFSSKVNQGMDALKGWLAGEQGQIYLSGKELFVPLVDILLVIVDMLPLIGKQYPVVEKVQRILEPFLAESASILKYLAKFEAVANAKGNYDTEKMKEAGVVEQRTGIFGGGPKWKKGQDLWTEHQIITKLLNDTLRDIREVMG